MDKSSEARRSKLSAEDWVLAAIAAMAEGGVENVKVERLAKRLNTTKGSFYWHFKDRNALLMGLMHYWVVNGTRGVMHRAAELDEKRSGWLRHLMEISLNEPVGSISSAQGEMAIRGWATTSPKVANLVAEMDKTRIDFVAEHLSKRGMAQVLAQQNARQLYMMLLGFYAQASYTSAHGDAAKQALLAFADTLVAHA